MILQSPIEGRFMARKYSKAAGRKVERAMDEMKHGTRAAAVPGRKYEPQQPSRSGCPRARSEGKKVPRKKATKSASGPREPRGPSASRADRSRNSRHAGGG